MKKALLIRGGRIIDPSQNMDMVGDLLIADGKIAVAGSQSVAQEECTRFDARGMVVCPGFVDLHCHLREPGFEEKETIATGTEAAARGGFTTLCCMPNTSPCIDTPTTVEYVNNRVKSEGKVRVFPVSTITMAQQGEELVDMDAMEEAGVVAFSDDGKSVADDQLLRQALEYRSQLGLPIIEHCEDASLAGDGVMNKGKISARLGLKGIPAAAEEAVIARDIYLAQETGARLHIAHVSTAHSVELICRAKEGGTKVTAEVTPHHLTLTEERVIGYKARAKVNPPLRTEEDCEALLRGLKEGVIDAIATDHAPHTREDKGDDLEKAAFGISGLETALGTLLALVHQEKLDLMTLVLKLTSGPAAVLPQLAGLGTLKTGAPADVTVFDPDLEWVVNTDNFASKGKNTPWEGCLLKGRVMVTVAGGEIVYQNDRVKTKIEGCL